MANEKRLIDANALTKYTVEFLDSKCEQIKVDIAFWSDIENAPTVDAVEVVHGRWVDDNSFENIVCTECGHMWNTIDNCTETFNYCPNCGAKMDGDGNG